MQAAALIEGRPAGWAVMTFQVALDCVLSAADTAEDGFFRPLCQWPSFCGMVSTLAVAPETGIVGSAASELDGDDISGSMVMDAPSLVVNGWTKYKNRHRTLLHAEI